MNKLEKRFPRYSRLLGLYPASYRAPYKEQMLLTLADMLDDKQTNKAKVWMRTTFDLPFSLIKENARYMGAVLTKEAPNYVKRSSIIGAILLAPFFTFIILDSLTSHSLYSGWFWHPWVVATWLIFMPAMAFVTCTVAFLRWYRLRKGQNRTGFWKSVFDWRHNWSLLVIMVISFGVIVLAFGHDSVHCVTHNPVAEIRYWHTTLRCIQNG